MKLSINSICPCGSGIKYKKCCKLLHNGKLPKNALELMKSRFSAFAYHEISYIINTLYEKPKDIAQFKTEVANFHRYTEFRKLDILEFIDGDKEAYVTFKAHLFTTKDDVSFTEKSTFIKKDNKWYYKSGEIS